MEILGNNLSKFFDFVDDEYVDAEMLVKTHGGEVAQEVT